MAKSTLPRFVAIDGLRAWMAWLVFASHIVQQANLGDAGNAWHYLFRAGNSGVQTFIIISGFVITHLLIERSEPYAAYLARRFMRLFPAFATCCCLGAACCIFGRDFGNPAWFEPIQGDVYRSLVAYYPIHALAHLTMLHGLIPNDVLPLSEYMFDPPAWSVSLEWQFYILAPLVVAGLRRANGWLILGTAAAILGAAHHHWIADHFRQQSAITGNLKYFGLGIASRYCAPRLTGSVRHPGAIGIASIAFFISLDAIAIGLWVATYCFILSDRDALRSWEQSALSAYRLLLESKLVQYLADRSYSTYLLHWPILTVTGALITHYFNLGGAALAAALTLAAIPVLVSQELLYRFVERPGQALGKAIASRLGEHARSETRAEVFDAGSGDRDRDHEAT